MKKKNEKAIFVEMLSAATQVEEVNKTYSVATATSATGRYTFGIEGAQSIADAAKECAKRYQSQIKPVKIDNRPTGTAIFLMLVSQHREIAGQIRDAIVLWTINAKNKQVVDFAECNFLTKFSPRYDEMKNKQERADWLARYRRRAANYSISRILRAAVTGTPDANQYYKLGDSFDYVDRVPQFPKAW